MSVLYYTVAKLSKLSVSLTNTKVTKED